MGLRRWLIDLVREAIREEAKPRQQFQVPDAKPFKPVAVTTVVKGVGEPSFEQMQAQSIQDQEKYYERP